MASGEGGIGKQAIADGLLGFAKRTLKNGYLGASMF